MNYYIQGSPARAEEIKAAFKKLGYDVTGFDMRNDNILFFTYKLQTGGKFLSTTNANIYTAEIIKTHPDYKELELPKPHYDIKNFKPFQKVLVRCSNDEEWMIEFYCKYDTLVHTSPHRDYPFMGIGDSYSQCIPFEGNEHLLGTTDMPSEEFINW